MRALSWYVVFVKDLKELVRNKKALALVTVMPLLLFGALGVLSNYSLTKTPTVIAVTNQDAGYAGHNYGDQLVSLIMSNGGSSYDLVLLNETSYNQSVQLVRQGSAVLALYIPPDFSEMLNRTEGSTNISVFQNPSNTKSTVVITALDYAVIQLTSQVVHSRLEVVSPGNANKILNPIDEFVAQLQVRGAFNTTISSPYGGMLPALIVLVSVETNVGLIVDSLIGEKERKTLEMLMVTPASKWEIITGKTLAILMISLVSAVAILVGILLEVSLTFSGLAASITPTSISVNPLEALTLVGILAATVAATQLITAALSAYATNTKEANASIGLVMSLPVVSMYPLLFAGLSSLPIAAQGFMYLLPFTYSYLLLSGVLIGPASVGLILDALALFGYIFLLLWITVRLYGREAVIVGGTRRSFSLFSRRKAVSATPERQSPSHRT